MSNLKLQNELILYFEKNNWVNTNKYKIKYYYEQDKNWVGFAQNKTYFSIYLANYFPLLDKYRTLEDKYITFTKSCIQIRENCVLKKQILEMLIYHVENQSLFD